MNAARRSYATKKKKKSTWKGISIILLLFISALISIIIAILTIPALN
ncbi:MAG: hypothetical protein KGD66_06480 [Candidatus Lokiarchaeota archaeon]|nr:hypothetical protein [Candidatus Lokiarchaeota archaeon]